ncbi:preprotein translocase subunit SecE [Microbacterium amylolyticum]|uniref:Protein translocase subunit SecE n=1 Tax=Microbacterium amylolyticum TaxID=936337 RepID=A0ABS4ZJD2_9MICO|nr:preprotein translocase subunit SecE [Microbacterium amylolyticum]MBP2437148.1 preprotein translocase subunit SecE [Microbacterium amylolyticum]
MSQEAIGGAAASASVAKKPNFFARILIFFREVIAELRKVVTPTRKELLKFTSVVLGFVVVMMAIIFGMDWIFAEVNKFVFGNPNIS